jgi:DNA polymerase III subunit delta
MTETKKQLFLWYGENALEIHEQLSGWVAAFEKKYSAINISSFDLQQSRSKDKLLAEVKNALQVDSLFGSNKLIVFRNFLASSSKVDADLKELLLSAFEKIDDNFFVIFVQTDSPDARSVLVKKIKALEKKGKAEVKEFAVPKYQALNKWIAERAQKSGTSFAPEAISLLPALVGNDLWQMSLEITKLANYKKGETVTREDVNLLVKGKYNDDIFQLMDAISAKDKNKALSLFSQQIQSGASEMYLLSMLVRQFRIFWQIKEVAGEANVPPDQVAKSLGLHPFVVKKSMAYLSKFSLAEIKRIYGELLEFDIKMKTSKVNFELLFDLLIAKL